MTTEIELPPARLSRARLAVSLCFFTNAVLYASLVPRYPQIKEGLDLTNASLGAALAAFPVGSLLAGPFSATLMRRFGSARVASVGLSLLALALLAVAAAFSWWSLAAALLLAGAVDAVVDVAQNAHGLRVQRLYGRSILNAMHGIWSIGAVAGGLLGAAAAGADIPIPLQIGVTGVVFAGLALFVQRSMLPGRDREPAPTPAADHHNVPVHHESPRAAGTRLRLPVGVLVALGVLAACGSFVEDAGASWAAIYLRTELATGAATAGLGFVALQVAMTIGRLTGDRVVDRFGQRSVAVAGGALTAVGMGFALAVPSVVSTLVGFALAGLGVATLIPAVFAAADDLPGLPPGRGLTIVNWLLRLGFVASPPAVGIIADATSLRVGLTSMVLAGLGAVVLGRFLAGRAPRI